MVDIKDGASMTKKLIYIAGSMKNREGIIKVIQALEAAGYDTFYDWIMPGEETDQKWQEFEQALGHDYLYALNSPHANDVFEFDKHWLDRADAFVLVYPAGRSAHTELGYMVGKGKPAFILLDGEPDRWDVMVLFANGVMKDTAELAGVLARWL